MPSTVLLATPEPRLGEFACASGDRLWDEVNDIGGGAHVVFPRTAVVIEQDGAQPVLVTPNEVVYYRPHQRYRRELRDARGDRSLWLEIAPEAGAVPSGPAGPCDARTYLLAVSLAGHLRAEPEPERLLAEEAAVRLQLGFDAIGLGDVNRDRRIDLLLSAAGGSSVYLVAGTR
jgi:hypothetical protein